MPDLIEVRYGPRRQAWIRRAAAARGVSENEYAAELLRIAGEAMNERIEADRELAGEVLRPRGRRR